MAEVTKIGMDVNNAKPTPKAVSDSGMKARGEAIATGIIECVKQQGQSLKMFLTDLTGLTNEGRKAFRSVVAKVRKEMQDHVKANEGTPDHAMLKKSLNVSCVRLSEAVSFTKAVDAGYIPGRKGDLSNLPYGIIIAQARMFLNSQSTGSARGVKPKTKVERIQAYISKLELKASEFKAVEALVHDMATVKPVADMVAEGKKAAVTAYQAKAAVVQKMVDKAANDSMLRAAAAAGVKGKTPGVSAAPF